MCEGKGDRDSPSIMILQGCMNIPIHNALSSLPLGFIGLTVLLVIFELCGWKRAQVGFSIKLSLFCALAAVVASFYTGYEASEEANKFFLVSDEVIVRHHNYGRLLLFLIIPTVGLYWIARHATHLKVLFNILFLALLMACSYLVIVTGKLGGELVFVHGAGVQGTSAVAPQK